MQTVTAIQPRTTRLDPESSYSILKQAPSMSEASLKSLDMFGFILGVVITLGPLAATALVAH